MFWRDFGRVLRLIGVMILEVIGAFRIATLSARAAQLGFPTIGLNIFGFKKNNELVQELLLAALR